MTEPFNYVYDPYKSGYDTTIWKTLTGTPTVASDKVVFNAGAAVMYSYTTGGKTTFRLNIPVGPTAADDRIWGLYSPATGRYAYFYISGTDFKAAVSDGTTTDTATLTWDTGFAAAAVDYSIIREAAAFKFMIGESVVATISLEDAGTSILIGQHPLSPYVKNANADNMNLSFVEILGATSYTAL